MCRQNSKLKIRITDRLTAGLFFTRQGSMLLGAYIKTSIKASAERLKAVTLKLRELNKKRKEIEKDEADAINRCASVIEFMDLDDLYHMTCSKIEVLTREKKMLQQMLKKSE